MSDLPPLTATWAEVEALSPERKKEWYARLLRAWEDNDRRELQRDYEADVRTYGRDGWS